MKVIVPLVFNPYEFSRASVATYYNSDGQLTEAGVDELRFGYDPTTLDFIGPILENAATNYLLKSTDFDGGVTWTNDTAITPRPAEVNPTGGTGADELNVSFSTASTTQFIGAGDIPSGTAMFSIFVKGLTPGPTGFYTVRLTINSAVSTTGVVSVNPANYYALESWTGIQKLPNDWFRIWIYGPVVSASGASFSISHINSGSAQRTLLWGAQAEMVSGTTVPTSFIETDTTIETRAADVSISQSPSVVSTNVEEDDAPVYNPGTTYNEGDEVMVLGSYHNTYIAVRTTTGEFPPDNIVSTGVDSDGIPIPPAWVFQGSTNRWRMFDMVTGIERQTIATDSDGTIHVIISIDGPIDSFALFNITGSHVKVFLRDAENNTVYSLEQDLLTEPDEIGWWSWFWGNRTNIDTIVRTDLPPFAPTTLEVIIEGGDDPAALGKLVIGDATDIGCVRFGVSGGIVDFSRKDRDTFGNSTVLPRRYIDRCEYDILLDTDDVSRVKKLLTEVRAIPVAYIGSEEEKYAMTAVFGFYRDFNIVIAGPVKSACALQVESI